jgi:hypothetical protein
VRGRDLFFTAVDAFPEKSVLALTPGSGSDLHFTGSFCIFQLVARATNSVFEELVADDAPA